MAELINTPYLGQGSSELVNTGYIGTGSASTEVEENPRTFTSEVSFTDVVSMDETLTLGSELVVDDAITGSSASYAGGVAATQFTASDSDFASINTAADFNDMTVGELRVVLAASGVSLGYSSGASLYIVNSALSAAQPTS